MISSGHCQIDTERTGPTDAAMTQACSVPKLHCPAGALVRGSGFRVTLTWSRVVSPNILHFPARVVVTPGGPSQAADARFLPRGVERCGRTADDHPHDEHGPAESGRSRDVCLLNNDRIRVVEGSVRPLLVNLTVPTRGLMGPLHRRFFVRVSESPSAPPSIRSLPTS